MSIDVMIPVYQPDQKLEQLLIRLVKQSIRPNKILLLNTITDTGLNAQALTKRVEKTLKNLFVSGSGDVKIRIYDTTQDEFDHGGSRAYMAHQSDAEYMLFMTQDAVPLDDYLIERFMKSFTSPKVAVAYARQLPNTKANALERYTREFNYPEQSCYKGKNDVPTLGIKAYYCSNVCAMYRKSAYEEQGGFIKKTIFNEDMILAAKLVEAGYLIAYVADAQVIHSHSYSIAQQFHRNFDLGVSHYENKEIFEVVPSEGEGIRLVKKTFAYLWENKEYRWIPRLFVESAAKYLGYFLGKHYTLLPEELVRSLSMNQGYWRKR